MSDNNLFKDDEINNSESQTCEPDSQEACVAEELDATTDTSVPEFEENLSDEKYETESADEPEYNDEAQYYVPNFVEYSAPAVPADPRNKKGLKVFLLIIAILLAVTAAATLGYFAGKNVFFGKTAIDHTMDLASKPSNTDQYSAEKVYEIVNKSVVGIAVYNDEGTQGYASGVIYSEDGYIITNDHIYDDVVGAKFKVYTHDGNMYSAEFVAGDTRSDLAVLKIDANGFVPAVFGNSDELNYGEQVVAIGRPNDATASSSITGGYISFLNRRVSNSTSYASKLIQTDSAINPGSSGGALVNMYGQVIGITSSKLVGNEYEGVGYAIPTTTVKFVIEELIEHGSVVSRAKLGISYTEIDAIVAEVNNHNITGLLVAEVTQESSLHGRINKGDVITEINGQKITKGDMVLDIIEASKPGDKIELTVYIEKKGDYKKFEAELVQAESTSSYKSGLPQDPNFSDNEDNNGPTFDFPYGY